MTLTLPVESIVRELNTNSMLKMLDKCPVIIDVKARPISIHIIACILPSFVIGVRSPYLGRILLRYYVENKSTEQHCVVYATWNQEKQLTIRGCKINDCIK